LEGLALCPSEEAILIENVVMPIEEVYEIYMYTMAECEGKVIRWPRNLLKDLTTSMESEEPFNPPSPVVFSINETENSGTSPTRPFNEFVREVHDGRRQPCPYIHHVHPHRRPPGPHIIGMSRVDRVSLIVVEADK
jgi:hypothetical protein